MPGVRTAPLGPRCHLPDTDCVSALVCQVSLNKVGEYWWNAILEGEEQIDIDQINKERSMATVDEEERAVLDRLAFDYQQKLQGKPQSHELVRALWGRSGGGACCCGLLARARWPPGRLGWGAQLAEPRAVCPWGSRWYRVLLADTLGPCGRIPPLSPSRTLSTGGRVRPSPASGRFGFDHKGPMGRKSFQVTSKRQRCETCACGCGGTGGS